MISALEMFSIGIGPSSSHTVGPMVAAHMFADALAPARPARITVRLLGSLGATGPGHGTDTGIMLGLAGEWPDVVAVDSIPGFVAEVERTGVLMLAGTHRLAFNPGRDIGHHPREIDPRHPNTMIFTAFDRDGESLSRRTYCSIGGGFVDEVTNRTPTGDADSTEPDLATPHVPLPFSTAAELLAICDTGGLRIHQVVRRNELARRSPAELASGLEAIWAAMSSCVERGLTAHGTLPGGLGVRRRAAQMHADLVARGATPDVDPMEWLTVIALAVNEENAAGGRVVTAPTNGAAGIIPAVLHRHLHTWPGASADDVHRFLLTATAIGWLIKTNASISGAEVGCQGEVGSACAMAAAGLAEVRGGTPAQVENAAEIGLEHNL
ncbi:MAG: L-serine dehydratase, partial [Actinomycetota bacterium]|nr:L-serine dehydratase [Actinomycetota bacterium]